MIENSPEESPEESAKYSYQDFIKYFLKNHFQAGILFVPFLSSGVEEARGWEEERFVCH